MTVNELIEKLSTLPPEVRSLPIAVADWIECCSKPSVELAQKLYIDEDVWIPDAGQREDDPDITGTRGRAVVLGAVEP